MTVRLPRELNPGDPVEVRCPVTGYPGRWQYDPFSSRMKTLESFNGFVESVLPDGSIRVEVYGYHHAREQFQIHRKQPCDIEQQQSGRWHAVVAPGELVTGLNPL